MEPLGKLRQWFQKMMAMSSPQQVFFDSLRKRNHCKFANNITNTMMIFLGTRNGSFVKESSFMVQ